MKRVTLPTTRIGLLTAGLLAVLMQSSSLHAADPNSPPDSLDHRRSRGDNGVTQCKPERRHHNDSVGSSLFGIMIDLFFNDDDDYTPTKSGRGSLSGAMKKASDENTGDRTVPEANVQFVPSPHDDVWNNPPPANREPAPSWDDLYNCIGFHFTSGSLKGGDYYGMWGAGGSVGLARFKVKRSFRLNAYMQFLNAPVQTTSGLHHSIRGGVGLYEWGFTVDAFTTPYYTFMGQYLMCGLGFTTLFWDFRNSLTDASGDAIMNDDLSGVNGYLGMGWNPMQFEHFEVGFEARMGAIGWVETTSEGFHNDFFPTFKYFQIVSNIKYKWE